MRTQQLQEGTTALHTYLKSVGFSEIKKRKQLREILRDVIENHDEITLVEEYEDGVFAEYSKYYSEGVGISVCGQIDEFNRFQADYYYPFFRAKGTTSTEPVTVEKHADKDSFAGSCDDYRIGVTLIFYIQKPAEYMKRFYQKRKEPQCQSLTLTGLVREGMVLLPIEKDKEAVKVEKEISKTRTDLINAARNGDEDAMESLTMDDMDTYSMISERIITDDVFTIVDTYFMPHGIECDQYNIMGEIVRLESQKNKVTGEEILIMTLDCNDIQFDICVNRRDLTGDPVVGRRFKGVVLLQGELHYT